VAVSEFVLADGFAIHPGPKLGTERLGIPPSEELEQETFHRHRALKIIGSRAFCHLAVALSSGPGFASELAKDAIFAPLLSMTPRHHGFAQSRAGLDQRSARLAAGPGGRTADPGDGGAICACTASMDAQAGAASARPSLSL